MSDSRNGGAMPPPPPGSIAAPYFGDPDTKPVTTHLDFVIDPPIEWNGTTYDVLHLREPEGREVRRAEGELSNGATFQALRDYQIALLSIVTGTPRAVIERMRVSQLNEAAAFFSPFLGGGPQTGAS